MCCSDPANTDGLNRAAEASADVSRDALSWYKATYAAQEPARQQAAAQAQKVSDAQVSAMDFATQQAKDADAYNRSTFRPIEQKIAADALTFDTPLRRADAAASAAADVDASAAAVRKAQEMELGRAGVAPGSARALAVQQDAGIGQVAARGGAMTNAVRNVEQQGYARTMDAAGLGRGVVSNQATQQQIATQAGNAGAGNAVTALNAATSGNGVMQQGFGTALQANQVAGNLYGQAAQVQQSGNNSMMGLLGTLGQGVGYALSDPKAKKRTGRMADTAAALKQVEGTPVEDGWTYKDDPKQTLHTGPMADVVRDRMGEEAAPGGKMIDLVSMNGRMLAAVQELSKRVKAIEKRVN